MDQWKTPGMAVGIIAEDRLVYAKGFGVRELGGETKVDESTLFEIGSTSKAFVAATLAIQVDQGRYDWNDRVIDLDPSFRLADPWVTHEFRIIDLLAQRSGLPAMALTDMAFYGYDAATIRRGLRHIEPVSSFRAQFGYQNAFHLVAGHLIETASKQPSWNDFAHQQLFSPLGMSVTTGNLDDVRKQQNVASGHYYDDSVKVMPRSAFPYNVVPAGGLNSNIRDMAQWVRLQINEGEVNGERIISAKNLLETRAPRILVTGMGSYSPEDTVSYANGWMIHNLPEGRLVEHGGSTGGFTPTSASTPIAASASWSLRIWPT